MAVFTPSYYIHKEQCKPANSQQSEKTDPVVYFEPYDRIVEIQYGIAIYPLQGDGIYAGYEQLIGNTGTPYCFQSNVLSPPICGKGTTRSEARENWQYEFHKTFQELSAKLDWERTEEEQNLWIMFEDIIDIPDHRRRTPVNFHQTGKIIGNTSIPSHQRQIEWIDGTTDIISCDDCPDLQQYKTGQYFRADLLRKYHTGKLIKIRSISPSKYRDFSELEINDFLDSLPTTKDLPASKIWK